MTKPISIILAEDDEDDRLFFRDALHEVKISTHLTMVSDGEQLMNLLATTDVEPSHVLFLDINMPRKSGLDCLAEIKHNTKLEALPIIVFSTCFDNQIIDKLHDSGANYYMRKPTGFLRLREIIERSLTLMQTSGLAQPPRENFVLNVML